MKGNEMREILFRGYNKIQNKWHYGMLDKFDHQYLINDGSGTKSYVEEESIGEYTGLEDKNDIMIFEGDRVTDKDGVGTVVFEKGIWYVVYDKNNLHFELGGMCVEIIGNVYEER